MNELITNLHMHTTYSDGSGSHADIGKAALATGLDVVIVTDHNVLVTGMEQYFSTNKRMVLMLVGQEIHDTARQPQKNHTLAIGINQDLSTYAPNPQQLINQIRKAGGLSFLAHPHDPAIPAFGEDDISWVSWDVQGYSGMELWNGFSELKNVAHNRLDGLFYAFFPQLIAHAPLSPTLIKWDELLREGKRVVAIGGSDAHALHMHLGPLHKVIFPYEFHFRAINTHILVEHPLNGHLDEDKQMVLDALRRGHAFIGYDLPHPTQGFRFSAQGKEDTVIMGDEISLGGSSVTMQIRIPLTTECKLIKNGEVIRHIKRAESLTYITNQPGAYRVECTIDYLGKTRGWIYSNPIYVRK